MKHGYSRIYCACLLAAAFAAAASRPACAQQRAGGDYALEASVIDNGGGGWLNGGEYASRGAIGQPMAPATQGKGGKYTSRTGFYNPPHLTYQKGLSSSLTLDNGAASLSMPANAVTDRETFEIGINRKDLHQDFIVDPAKVEEATRKMVASEGAWAQFFENDLTEAYIFDEQSLTTDPLTASGVLSLRYRDANNDGFLDNTSPPVKVDTLNAWALDEKVKLWVKLPAMGLDKENKTITVNFRGPGVYTMLGAADDNVKDVKPYPVPFRPFGPDAGLGNGKTGTEASGILFGNLPDKGEISIYTLDGQLVKKIDIASSLEAATVGCQHL